MGFEAKRTNMHAKHYNYLIISIIKIRMQLPIVNINSISLEVWCNHTSPSSSPLIYNRKYELLIIFFNIKLSFP